MKNLDYSYKKFLLEFIDINVERIYRTFAIKRTLLFSRITWIIVVTFGLTFSLLDKISFGERASEVFFVRLFVVFCAAIMLLFSFREKERAYLRFNSFVFINLIGIFSIYLTLISPTLFFTPYVIGIVMAFTGVFINTGIGFKHSFKAILGVCIFFVYAVFFLSDLPIRLVLVYSFFITALAIIFIYISYLVERIFRENFAYSIKLKDSIRRVKQLKGLIPICAKCKKIRDDDGYWEKIEKYISEHSGAEFTHSLCPQCSESLINEVDQQIKLDI